MTEISQALFLRPLPVVVQSRKRGRAVEDYRATDDFVFLSVILSHVFLFVFAFMFVRVCVWPPVCVFRCVRSMKWEQWWGAGIQSASLAVRRPCGCQSWSLPVSMRCWWWPGVQQAKASQPCSPSARARVSPSYWKTTLNTAFLSCKILFPASIRLVTVFCHISGYN